MKMPICDRNTHSDKKKFIGNIENSLTPSGDEVRGPSRFDLETNYSSLVVVEAQQIVAEKAFGEPCDLGQKIAE